MWSEGIAGLYSFQSNLLVISVIFFCYRDYEAGLSLCERQTAVEINLN